MTPSLTVPYLLPLSAFLAGALLLASSRSTRWSKPAKWIALALIGQAATLRIIRAGPVIRYEHAALPWEWAGQEQLAGALLLLQGIIVSTALWRRRGSWTGIASHPWRLVAGLVVFMAGASSLSPEPAQYAGEALFRSMLQVVALGNALLIGSTLPVPRGTGEWPRWWLAALGMFVTTAAAALAFVVYERHPHVPDEVAYLIQAGYMAAGRLSLASPPVPAAFNVDLLVYDPTRIYSVFPPGWPVVLAAGSWVGLAWLVNPVLAGLNILLCHRLLRECYDDATARLGTVLLAFSPWHLFMGMSLMSHTLTLTLALAAAISLAIALRRRRWPPLIGSGILIGSVSLIRPLDGLVLAATLGLVALAAAGNWWQRIGRTALLAAATLVASLTVLPYNAALTGEAGTFPVMLYFDRYYGPGSNDLGFGPNRGVGWSGIDPLPGHGAPDVAISGLINLFQVNTELLGWATGSLAPLLLLLVFVPKRSRAADKAMLVGIAVVIGLHAFYWFSGGPDFGARYWFLLIVPAIALAARGLCTLDEVVRPGEPMRGPATRTGLVLCLLALATFMPWRAGDKYWHYRGMQRGVRELAAGHRIGRALVLIQGQRHPDYHGAAVYNPVDLRSGDGPIYAWDRTPEIRAALVEAYPDRQFWLIAGPSVTGNGYRIIAGPLAPAEALELPPPPSYPSPPGPNP